MKCVIIGLDKRRSTLPAWLGMLLFASVAQAQPPVGGPGPGAPTAVSPLDSGLPRPGDERLERPRFLEEKPEPPFTLPEVPEQPEEAPLSTGPRFVVRNVTFEGNTVFSDEELLEVAAPFVGRTIGTEELQKLRRELTLYYVNRGYINSGAVLPDQEVVEGHIRFVIVEGQLDEINVSGTTRLYSGYVSSRLALGAGPPLNIENLQERIQILLDDPHIERLDARLSPGVRPGESELKVRVEERSPATLWVTFANSRPPSVGSNSLRANFLLRSVLGVGELISFYTERTEGLSENSLMFEVPITKWDTRFWARYRGSDAEVVEEPFDALDIESSLDEYLFGVVHPVYRGIGKNFELGLGFAVRNSETSLSGQPFSFSPGVQNGGSDVSVISFDQSWTDRRRNQVLALRSQLRFGIDAFGATINPGALPDGEYFAWLGQAQWARRLNDWGWQLILRGNGQFTNDRLLPLEKFNVGGAHSVRGYRENQLVADNGYAVSIESRIPLFRSSVPQIGIRDVILEVAPFFDFGQAWNTGGKTTTIDSVGVGLLLSASTYFRGFVYYGKQLKSVPDPPDNDLQDDGIHFSVQGNISW